MLNKVFLSAFLGGSFVCYAANTQSKLAGQGGGSKEGSITQVVEDSSCFIKDLSKLNLWALNHCRNIVERMHDDLHSMRKASDNQEVVEPVKLGIRLSELEEKFALKFEAAQNEAERSKLLNTYRQDLDHMQDRVDALDDQISEEFDWD